eukprot:jgi/Botrbrau1/7767/Bobra.0159s0195.1
MEQMQRPQLQYSWHPYPQQPLSGVLSARHSTTLPHSSVFVSILNNKDQLNEDKLVCNEYQYSLLLPLYGPSAYSSTYCIHNSKEHKLHFLFNQRLIQYTCNQVKQHEGIETLRSQLPNCDRYFSCIVCSPVFVHKAVLSQA